MAVTPTPAARTSLADTLAVYLQRRVLIVMFLGFSSGLPLALSGSTLLIWMRESGVNLGTIGLFALVGTPYTVKFAWAPLIDALDVPILSRLLGRRRGWLLLSQFLLMAAIVFLALCDPSGPAFVVALGELCKSDKVTVAHYLCSCVVVILSTYSTIQGLINVAKSGCRIYACCIPSGNASPPAAELRVKAAAQTIVYGACAYLLYEMDKCPCALSMAAPVAVAVLFFTLRNHLDPLECEFLTPRKQMAMLMFVLFAMGIVWIYACGPR